MSLCVSVCVYFSYVGGGVGESAKESTGRAPRHTDGTSGEFDAGVQRIVSCERNTVIENFAIGAGGRGVR